MTEKVNSLVVNFNEGFIGVLGSNLPDHEQRESVAPSAPSRRARRVLRVLVRKRDPLQKSRLLLQGPGEQPLSQLSGASSMASWAQNKISRSEPRLVSWG